MKAIIVGASSGIGLEIAKQLLAEAGMSASLPVARKPYWRLRKQPLIASK